MKFAVQFCAAGTDYKVPMNLEADDIQAVDEEVRNLMKGDYLSFTASNGVLHVLVVGSVSSYTISPDRNATAASHRGKVY
jgi:hypothetical protein